MRTKRHFTSLQTDFKLLMEKLIVGCEVFEKDETSVILILSCSVRLGSCFQFYSLTSSDLTLLSRNSFSTQHRLIHDVHVPISVGAQFLSLSAVFHQERAAL